MYGARLEATFHIVVGQVTSIRNIARCVKSSDLELKALNLEPLASAMAVLSQEEKEAGVVLVDIGGGTTDIAIFKDGIIRHTAVIPYGGNIITNDIKEGCSIIEKQAEQLKVKFGSAWPGENKENEIVSIPGLRGRDPKEISLKTLSRIIHARTTEIINAVFTEVKNYGYDQPSRKLIAGVVITGGGSQLKHLVWRWGRSATNHDCVPVEHEGILPFVALLQQGRQIQLPAAVAIAAELAHR
jgi:cell division protein FtsA